MLETRRLRHFLAIYELGSIGQAAERLLLTQPALSKSLRHLEDDLGVRLFDRTAHGVVPTVYGDNLALHARAIEQQVKQAEAAIRGMQGRAKGHVRVGVGPSVAMQIAPAAALMVRRLHPDLEITVIEGLVDELVPMLRRRELEIAIGAWPKMTDTAFFAETLITDTIQVVARADHPLVGRPVTLNDLLEQAWALPPPTQRWRQLFEAVFVDQGLVPPAATITSNSSAFLNAMLRNSDTVSFLPRQLTSGTQGLVVLDIEGMPRFDPEITMSYRERALSDPACMEVIHAFRAVTTEVLA